MVPGKIKYRAEVSSAKKLGHLKQQWVGSGAANQSPSGSMSGIFAEN